MQARLARGWNTWNTTSILSHVLLPEGLAVDLTIREFGHRTHLREVLIGRKEPDREHVRPGLRTWDGSYTELTFDYRQLQLSVRTGLDGGDFVALVELLSDPFSTPLLVVEAGLLWNRQGTVRREGHTLRADLPARSVTAYATSAPVEYPNIHTGRPYLAISLRQPVGISTGRPRTPQQIRDVLDRCRQEAAAPHAAMGKHALTSEIMQTVLAWNTIYEPTHQRIISPVSRIWNVGWGGYVLFDWDTYFAAWMASLTNREIAYANLVEISREAGRVGFVPNCTGADGNVSLDRSQPPVGALTAMAIYDRFGEKWVLEEIFDCLLTWNRWWPANRSQGDLLAWGSHKYQMRRNVDAYRVTLHSTKAASRESGLDNSPMYDDVPFDPRLNQMLLADVGLMGFYVADCDALARMAEVLSRPAEKAELAQRGDRFRRGLRRLWNDQRGIFCNLRTDTGEFSPRLSPTCFYPMLAGAATDRQVRRMIDEHFLNPAEFGGEWILPSISRDDPAYKDQEYWRGRVWAPMNFLVYLGLRNYDVPSARRILADRSLALLMKEWREHGHVHENYNAITGEGDDVKSSDGFYHWGGLLGLIAMMEEGGA
jgi:hypothetical protein